MEYLGGGQGGFLFCGLSSPSCLSSLLSPLRVVPPTVVHMAGSQLRVTQLSTQVLTMSQASSDSGHLSFWGRGIYLFNWHLSSDN
jgi:hypothetical protein